MDFSNGYIIFRSSMTPKAGYDGTSNIKSIIIKDNELNFEISRGFGITVLNETGIKHPHIFIAKVNKEDIPSDLKNIYKVDKDYVPYD